MDSFKVCLSTLSKMISVYVQSLKLFPRNAIYIYPDMQNKLIAAMSSVVTIDIKQEIGNSWYTIKVDGAKDPTGVENISTIIRFLQRQSLKVADRLLISSSNN